MSAMADIRASITFTGKVQGVGFRATTRSIAREFNVTGWVRNEPDRSVRCVVEGEAGEVERFIKQVQATMQGFIRNVQVDTSPATGEFAGFRIEH